MRRGSGGSGLGRDREVPGERAYQIVEPVPDLPGRVRPGQVKERCVDETLADVFRVRDVAAESDRSGPGGEVGYVKQAQPPQHRPGRPVQRFVAGGEPGADVQVTVA